MVNFIKIEAEAELEWLSDDLDLIERMGIAFSCKRFNLVPLLQKSENRGLSPVTKYLDWVEENKQHTNVTWGHFRADRNAVNKYLKNLRNLKLLINNEII